MSIVSCTLDSSQVNEKRWLVKWMKKSYWCHICKNSGGIRINIFLLRPATLIPATRLSYQNCGLRSWHGAGEYPWEATYILPKALSLEAATFPIILPQTKSSIARHVLFPYELRGQVNCEFLPHEKDISYFQLILLSICPLEHSIHFAIPRLFSLSKKDDNDNSNTTLELKQPAFVVLAQLLWDL
jgi:hypothetical protein